jgi:hypothetical protein
MAGSWHDMGCSCCADNWVDEGILGNEDLNHFIVRDTCCRAATICRLAAPCPPLVSPLRSSVAVSFSSAGQESPMSRVLGLPARCAARGEGGTAAAHGRASGGAGRGERGVPQ